MKIHSFILLVVVLFISSLRAQVHESNVDVVVYALQTQDSVQAISLQQREAQQTKRRTTALLYSLAMPGSGQTMLGHPYKGVGFTLAAFGSLLTAVISHNNFIASNERLDALEFQYANATNWVSANTLYNDMIGVEQKLKLDRNRRNIFLAITAVIWAANVVDVLYNTEDQGQTIFSQRSLVAQPATAFLDLPHRPLVAFSIDLQ
ncbi:MAG: DUF5683 domain-containing protein [Bacteroidota bacterium]